MKGKEKKQKRKEENVRVAAKQGLVDAANAVCQGRFWSNVVSSG